MSFSFGQNDLREVGDAEPLAVRQLDRAVLPRVLERAELGRRPRRVGVAGAPSACLHGARRRRAARSRARRWRLRPSRRARFGSAAVATAGSLSTIVAGPCRRAAEIHRMPQLAIGGPLGEAHLRDELGPDPVRRLVGLDAVRERRRRRSRAPSAASRRVELLLIEAGAGVADVDERPARLLVVVDAEQQRAEVRARVCRGSVQPPTTNSCSLRSLSLRHAGLRRPD